MARGDHRQAARQGPGRAVPDGRRGRGTARPVPGLPRAAGRPAAVSVRSGIAAVFAAAGGRRRSSSWRYSFWRWSPGSAATEAGGLTGIRGSSQRPFAAKKPRRSSPRSDPSSKHYGPSRLPATIRSRPGLSGPSAPRLTRPTERNWHSAAATASSPSAPLVHTASARSSAGTRTGLVACLLAGRQDPRRRGGRLGEGHEEGLRHALGRGDRSGTCQTRNGVRDRIRRGIFPPTGRPWPGAAEIAR